MVASWLQSISYFRDRTQHAPLPSDIIAALGDAQSIGASTSDIAPALQQLQHFIHSIFVWNLPPSFFIQMGVAAILILLLFLAGGYMVLHRLLRQKFWLIRLTRRPSGLYFVPNAYNCFLLLIGCFAVAWFAFVILVIQGYHYNVGSPQRVLIFLSSYVWCPLYIAAYFAGWGSFYTAPNALASLDGKRKSRWWLQRPKAWVLNLICLGTPLLLAGSLIPPTVLGQMSSNTGWNGYIDWSARINDAISADTTLSAMQLRTFIAQANDIWSEQAEALRLLAIAYTLWAAWAGCLLTFYIAAGGYLVVAVWRQLRRQKELLESVRRRQHGPVVVVLNKTATPHKRQSTTERTLVSPRMSDFRRNSVEQAAQEVSAASALLFQPLSMSTEEDATVIPGRHMQTLPSSAKEGSADTQHIFFPPLRPDAQRRAMETYNPNGTPASRYRYIRRCFIHLTTLYFGIIFGVIVYLFTTARLAARLYEAVLAGPSEATSLIYESHIPPAYANIVFGTLTVGSIWSRYFDSASAKSSPRSMTRERLTHKKQFSASEADGGHMQERTRTLPAVPQSVSASSHGGGEDEALRPPSAALLAIPRGFSERRGIFNFRLGRDVAKPNELVMQPMDVSGVETDLMDDATFERLEAEQTGTHRSGRSARSHGSRRGALLALLRPGSSADKYPQNVSAEVSAMEEGSFGGYESGASSNPHRSVPSENMPAVFLKERPLAPTRTPPVDPYVLDGARTGRSSMESASNAETSLGRLSHRLTATSSRLTFSSFGSKSDMKVTAARKTPLPADVPPAPRTPLRALPRQSSDTSSSRDSMDGGAPHSSSPREWIAREWAATDARNTAPPPLTRSLSLIIVPGTHAPSRSIHRLGINTPPPPPSSSSSPTMGRPASSYSLQQAMARASPSPFGIAHYDAAAAILNPDAISGATTPDLAASGGGGGGGGVASPARSSFEGTARRTHAEPTQQRHTLPPIPPSPVVGYSRRRRSSTSSLAGGGDASPSSVFGELPQDRPRSFAIKRVPVPSAHRAPYTSPKRAPLEMEQSGAGTGAGAGLRPRHARVRSVGCLHAETDAQGLELHRESPKDARDRRSMPPPARNAGCEPAVM